MKKLTTPSHLLLHVYGELDAADQRSLSLALHYNEVLQAEINQLRALKTLLDNSCPVPSIATIQRIKAYARAVEVFTDRANKQHVYLLN